MADLSTPLLDSVITKLTNPTLDCRTLVHENPTNPSGNATAETQQSILSNQEMLSTTPIIASRTIHPTTVQPTTPLYCPDDITGPRQIDGCTGECSRLIFWLPHNHTSGFICLTPDSFCTWSVQAGIIASWVNQYIPLSVVQRALCSMKQCCFVCNQRWSRVLGPIVRQACPSPGLLIF